MSTLREDLLGILDFTRGIPADLDLRRYDVLIRIRQWSGTRPGLGTKTIIDLPILVDENRARPKVKLLSTREVIASNGFYIDGDFRIGRITPQYLDGYVDFGYTPDDIRPLTNSQPREIFFQLTGPGMDFGAWFSTVEVSVERNLHYTFIIRKTAQEPI